MTNRLQRIASVAAIIIVVGLLTATVALANGVPVRLFLNYLPDISNWGPQTATGSAMVGVGDGFVQLSVSGLPHLNGEKYTVWLSPQDEGDWVRIGTFNVDETGAGDFGWTPEVFPYQQYRLIVITVEPDPDTDGKPDERVSLVGHFPNSEAVASTPSTETQKPGGGEQPDRLPVTGGMLESASGRGVNLSTSQAVLLTSMLWLVIGLGGWWATQRRRAQ